MTADQHAPSSVTIRFTPDHDGTGQLSITASAAGFAGIGSAWFGERELIEFAESLKTFPLPPTSIAVRGGFWGRPSAEPVLEQELVGLQVYPVGGRGQVGIRIYLAGEAWPDTRPESVPEVRLEVLTTYERLRRFSKDFASVVSGRLAEATLEEELLA